MKAPRPSYAQLAALRAMVEHGPLRYVRGGWWTWEGCLVHVSPWWSTTIQTLRGLERRGWAHWSIADRSATPPIYGEMYEITDAGRAVLDENKEQTP